MCIWPEVTHVLVTLLTRLVVKEQLPRKLALP